MRPRGTNNNMEYFLQQLINGITLGSIYGLIAIGYTMVYGIIGMINFAHGEVFMIGSFIALTTFLVLISFGLTFLPLILLVIVIVAMLFTSLWGWTSNASPIVRCAARSAWRRSSPPSACRSSCRTSSR